MKKCSRQAVVYAAAILVAVAAAKPAISDNAPPRRATSPHDLDAPPRPPSHASQPARAATKRVEAPGSKQAVQASRQSAREVTVNYETTTPGDYGFESHGDYYGSAFDEFGCECRPQFTAGFALTFLTPHFGDNVGFTITNSDGANFDTISPTQFDYGLQVSPRVWLEYANSKCLGVRARYWQFQHSAGGLMGTSPANGFGLIETPQFDGIGLSTSVPESTLSATSGLDLYALDLEGTKGVSFGDWALAASAGLRVGAFRQDYGASLYGPSAAQEGEINFSQNLTGAGPTFALEARRSFLPCLSFFSMARGALVFGDLESSLAVGEDLDLTTPFQTTAQDSSLASVPIMELQVGADWSMPMGCATFFAQTAMEAQWWQGIGNATSAGGSVGLFGFNTACGLAW